MTCTGVGSMPGVDPWEAMRIVVGELGVPHIVELPRRGPAAGMVPRTSGLLTELYVDLQPHGWRLVPRPGRDHLRAQAMLRQDLDALEEAMEGRGGPLKLQVAGPWTLAASLDLTLGDKALSDPGACRDLAESLADGVRLHVAEVARRTGAQVFLQLDEPSLPGVLEGTLPTASGWGRLRRPDESEVRGLVAKVLQNNENAGVHSCGNAPPIALLREAGAAWLGVDLTIQQDEDALAEAIEAGLGLHAGLVDPVKPLPTAVADSVAPMRRFWTRTGLEQALMSAVMVTPTCGLAGSVDARAQLTRCREIAEELAQ